MTSKHSPAAASNFVADRPVNLIGETFADALISATALDAGDPIVGRRHVDAFACLEPLEARQLMSVSLNGAGFTVVTPAADSRVVYVSSTEGSDRNAGLSAHAPVKTLAKAMTMIRGDSADQLLLKRGDEWKETFGFWKKSGRSDQEPILISAYGEGDRPLVNARLGGTGIVIGSISARTVSHVAIVGIHFEAGGRDSRLDSYSSARDGHGYGVQVISGGSGILIEDVKVDRFRTNISFVPVYGEMHDVTVRRSIVTDAWSSRHHAQGLFMDGVRGITVEQNTFNHNGWLEDAPGATATLWNHNIYITGRTSDVVVSGNLLANASSHGLQARSGGVVTGNLFLNNAIGMSYGLVNGEGVQKEGGVYGEVSGNVFLGGRDINGAGRGIGIEIANVRDGAGTVIKENIFSKYAGGVMPAIMLTSGVGVNQDDAVGLHDLTLRDNVVYQWNQGLSVQPGMSPTNVRGWKKMENVTLRGNQFLELSTTKVLINTRNLQMGPDAAARTRSANGRTLTDPDRTILSYDRTIGGPGTMWHYVRGATGRDPGTVDARYTATSAVNYIRGGFGFRPISGVTPTPMPNPVPPPTPVPVPPPGPTPEPEPVPEPDQDGTGTPVVGAGPNGSNGSNGHVRRKDAAVRVRSVKLVDRHGVQKLVVKFNRDVGSSLDLNDLRVAAAGGADVDLSGFSFSYDAKRKRAVWTMNDTSAERLTKGQYTMTLAASGIVDANSRHLDGNRDRLGGDDFQSVFKVRKVARAA